MRQHQHHHPTTTVVAILGTEALSEDILARLLEREGYTIRHLEAPPTGLADEMLEGVDILLLSPGLKDRAREGFLGAMRSNPKTSAIPVLPLSSALKLALLDELSAGSSWGGLFEELVHEIRAALTRAAASVEALVVEGEGAG
jgi:DNA-binding response OmpR family regulator